MRLLTTLTIFIVGISVGISITKFNSLTLLSTITGEKNVQFIDVEVCIFGIFQLI